MNDRKCVVLGLLGSRVDAGKDSRRWENWRPTVSVCQHEDFLVDRFELIYERRFGALAKVVSRDIVSVSPETHVATHEVDLTDPWDFEEVYATLHNFARSYPFSPERESYYVHITTGSHVVQICWFLLTESRHVPAVLLQTSPPVRKKRRDRVGAFRLIDLDLSRYDRLATRFDLEQKDSVSFLKSGIETKSPDFNRQITQIERVAIRSKEPILLMGPTGAGKSQLARRIFELKKLKRQLGGEFIEVNCATLRGDQAMSSLFGHIKGAFTGATKDRPGLLRAADGGMLFLDEIGELNADEQAMLLRALEEKRFLPVGADQEVKSDFQLIAGTNRDLLDGVANGTFREDLLARINLWTFRLPGLVDRREDIEPNIAYELKQFAAATGSAIRFNKEALGKYLTFAQSAEATWRGNFRDLNASMTRMGTLAASGRITVDVVEEEIGRLKTSWAAASTARKKGGENDDSLLLTFLSADELAGVDLFDRHQLTRVLE